MAQYIYPAIFTKEETGYSVQFPDIKNCFTDGDTLVEAMQNAEDALCLVLYTMEERGDHIPAASSISDLETGKDEFTSLVGCDTMEYRCYYDNKAVKKTLSIPAWLNKMADREGINFSAVLQEALKQKLNLC